MNLITKITSLIKTMIPVRGASAYKKPAAPLKPRQLAGFVHDRFVLAVVQFKTDSLFRNAVYLMASTAIMAVLGLGFWIFLSRLYVAEEIGTASALISITILIGNLSSLGLNAGIVRFLPHSKNRSGDINAAMILVTLMSILAAIAYLFWVGDDMSGRLTIFTSGLGGYAMFIGIMIAVSLNSFTDSIFIASRRVEFHTIVYACFGAIKLILPIFLIPLGSLGIMAAYSAAVVASFLLSLVFMARYCGYRFFARPDWGFIRDSAKYSSNNYIASLLAGVPSQVLPSLVLFRLGGAKAAYFSLAWTMAALLFVAPSAVTKSLLAEGSHDQSKRQENLKSAIKLLTAILVPAVIASILLAPYILRIFGSQYAVGSTLLFQLLALCTFCFAANTVGDTIMNLEHRSRGIVLVQIVVAVLVIGLSWFLMGPFGLPGVGVAILVAFLTGNLVQFGILKHRANRRAGSSSRFGWRTAPGANVIQEFLDQYGLHSARVGSDIGGGDRSGTYVVTDGKRKYVLKIMNTRKRSEAQLEEEIEFMQFLRLRGVPTPEVLPTGDDRLICHRTIKKVVWLGMLMKFETGQTPKVYTPEVVASIARAQGMIHAGGAEFGRPVTATRKFSLLSPILSFAPKGLSHFDFYSSNILIQKNEVSCVLDFEGMRYDPLVVCVLYTLTRLYLDVSDRSRLELYLQSYQNVRQLSPLEKLIIRVGLLVRFQSPKMLKLRY